MCVLALAWKSHPRWPLVLAGNRDERHDRPAAPLARWEAAPEVLGGRDLEAGGTWLGVSEAGRLAVVTNVRGFGGPPSRAPSRGLLVRDLLIGRGRYAAVRQDELAAFSPMNLILVCGGEASVLTNQPAAAIRPLAPGLHGLANGPLDDQWPKTRRLKAALAAWLEAGDGEPDALFAALADRTPAPDDELPSTGLGLERERLASPVFIAGEVYGTRCSTVVRVDADGKGEIQERRYGPGGAPLGGGALAFIWPSARL